MKEVCHAFHWLWCLYFLPSYGSYVPNLSEFTGHYHHNLQLLINVRIFHFGACYRIKLSFVINIAYHRFYSLKSSNHLKSHSHSSSWKEVFICFHLINVLVSVNFAFYIFLTCSTACKVVHSKFHLLNYTYFSLFRFRSLSDRCRITILRGRVEVTTAMYHICKFRQDGIWNTSKL